MTGGSMVTLQPTGDVVASETLTTKLPGRLARVSRSLSTVMRFDRATGTLIQSEKRKSNVPSCDDRLVQASFSSTNET